MKTTVSFDKRDLSGPQPVDGYTWQIERLTWRAVGGCWSGRLRATAGQGPGSLARLWELVDLLRCPVTISDHQPAWWGYVSAVEIHAPARNGKRGIVARISLDEMWNRGMVEYYAYNPASYAGDRYLTSIQSAAESISHYGYKERVFKAARQMNEEQADAYLSAMLQRYGLPVKTMNLKSGGPGGYSAVLELRGWWETLDWRFFTDTRGRLGYTLAGTNTVLGVTARKWAQSFTVGAAGWSLSEMWLKLNKAGLPADNLIARICPNTAGLPGAALGSVTLAGGGLGNEEGVWTKFALAAKVALAASTTYWITIERSGAPDAANYYGIFTDQTAGYGGGEMALDDGAGWALLGAGLADMGFMAVGTVDAYDQIANILDATTGCGQFITGCRVETTIGVESIPYRDGSTRGREEIEMHLATGTMYAQRLLAEVDPARRARVYGQPEAEDARLAVDESGLITNQSTGTLKLSENPAGKWVRLGGLAMAGTAPGFENAVFVEACRWAPGEGFRIGE